MIARKKILFIPRWYPDRHDSMLGLFVQKHAQAVSLFHEVSVLYVTADSSLAAGKIHEDQTVFEGIREHRIYFGKYKLEVCNAWAYAKNYLYGISVLKKKSDLPDIVHVHILSRTAFPALFLKFSQGIPYFITEHWSRYLPVNIRKGSYSGLFRKLFTRLAASQASGITTVTKNLAGAMQQVGLQNNYHITPNVADIHDFKPGKINDNKHLKKLVHISCFDEPAKNIKGIINVIEKLARERNDFFLEIIGDGKDFKIINDHAVKTGLTGSRIFFTGLVTGKELSEKLRNSDAMIMFSNYENLPCTIIESLCSGVPVISSDVGGISEHIGKEFGILVNAGDEYSLKEAIKTMLDHPEKYNREKMRSYAETNFSMEKIGYMFHQIYFPKHV